MLGTVQQVQSLPKKGTCGKLMAKGAGSEGLGILLTGFGRR